MTTIACDGNTIVSESYSTVAGIYVGSVKKVRRLSNGDIFASCGMGDDSVNVFEWLNNSASEKPKVDEGFAAFVLKSDSSDLILYAATLTPMPQSKPAFLGSGWEIALGAYDVCGDLIKSVQTACKFDLHSGGVIQVESLDDDS